MPDNTGKNGEIKYNITDAEWKVMKALWEKKAYNPETELSLGEIVDALRPGITWSMHTVKMLLIRLADKDIVKMNRPGHYHKYHAIAKENDCAVQETKTLVDKVFGGSAALMVSTLINSGGLSPEDKAEILKLIESVKNDGGE